MNTDRRRAVAALTTAGLAWGTTVPLSKLALAWLAPGWLTFARFGAAAAVLLAAASRPGLRAAFTPPVLASGAIGYGGSVVVQNVGITRTSVTHAALLIGAVPVLVAIIAALWHRTVARPVAWAGFAVSLAGVGLIAGGRGGGATAGGDALVLASLLLSATFTVAQGRLLRSRDPVAVTAMQFLGAALAVLPFSVAAEGIPSAPHGPGAVLAAAGLAVGGTLLPFTLFAYGQSRVSAEVAGAFLNLEPLIGAVTGAVFFGDPVGPAQVIGGVAIIAGIALSSLPLLAGNRRGPRACGAAPAAKARRPAPAAGKRPPAAQVQARSTPTSAAGCPDGRPPVTGRSRHHAVGRGARKAHHRPGRRRSGGGAPAQPMAERPRSSQAEPQLPAAHSTDACHLSAGGNGRRESRRRRRQVLTPPPPAAPHQGESARTGHSVPKTCGELPIVRSCVIGSLRWFGLPTCIGEPGGPNLPHWHSTVRADDLLHRLTPLSGHTAERRFSARASTVDRPRFVTYW